MMHYLQGGDARLDAGNIINVNIIRGWKKGCTLIDESDSWVRYSRFGSSIRG
jgi:hypothetical protein